MAENKSNVQDQPELAKMVKEKPAWKERLRRKLRMQNLLKPNLSEKA